MTPLQLQKARFMSPDHRAFVELANHQKAFSGWGHWLILLLIAVFPGSDVLIWKEQGVVKAGLILSRLQLPYWAYKKNRRSPRREFFQHMKKEGRRYASYAVVDPKHRGKGLFKAMMKSITEPIFLICLDQRLAESMRKLGATDTDIPNLSNREKTCYQRFNGR